eukprot:TRINITY_DN39612_c0_g1_i1.p1 TRINITY_DN39612_c0_g1~~TRINITY_DN39612_c0_g1_i1.p1  ORF type:complete len:568 (-),score=72.18 TRINITY_DN39612_c0_g1_i1:134-1837(-)
MGRCVFVMWRVCSAGLALILFSCYGQAVQLTILQPPVGKSGTPAAWIVFPGAQIKGAVYEPLARAVQKETSMPLWVAILDTSVPLAPTPMPFEIGAGIDSALKAMEKQGLDLSTVKLFYGGHSLGSVFIQDHLHSYFGSTGPLGGKVQVLGQVLMGGFIQRKYVFPEWSYPVTTLTVGGELDGLARPTRLAEAFYASKGRPDFPVVIIKGMNHMQFASGEAPMLVRSRDLQPEISAESAFANVASVIAPYFEQLAGVDASTGGLELALRQRETEAFLKPILAAYEMEGARYINAPAQIGGPRQDQCVKGGCPSKSKWVPRAQEIISAVEGWKLDIDNEFVDCSSTPLTGAEFHLPVIKNDTASKTISMTTYTQAYWDDATPSWFDWKEIFDYFDTGFIPTSAEELGSKLASRQCTLIQGAGQPDTPFSVDDPDFCKQANMEAYQWALQNAGTTAAERFAKYGQKYTFGADIPKSGGPLFLNARLQFKEVTGADGEKAIEVSAPMQKTEIDYWSRHFGPIPRPSFIPDPGCFHYCKLLSPARAMEWIYVDSLRLKKSLNSPTEMILFG